MQALLHMQRYSVAHEDKQIINDITLSVQAGVVDVLMGPNGSGKSTLALSIMGHPAYSTVGALFLDALSLHDVSVHKRAQAGLFLSFQHPYALPGVSVALFLKAAYESVHGPIEPKVLQQKIYAYLDMLELEHAFYYRDVNEGFSGGQKKKLEILQLLLLRPRIAILDEIDSGLDVDALRVVARALTYMRTEYPSMSMLLITHYQRILHYLPINQVHVLMNGALVASGDIALAERIEQHGYDICLQK